MSDGFLKQKAGFATTAIHAGQAPGKCNSGAVVPPIYMSTTYKQSAPGVHAGYVYSRSGNPTRNALEECLAALDGANYAISYASGLGAITTVLALLKNGDHLLSGHDLYGGTSRLFREVASNSGIEVTWVDLSNLDRVNKAIQPNTKMLWVESPTNPLLAVLDISALVKLVKRNADIIVVVDNTFLTPYLQKPLDFGVDIVLYSLTKYMNGHSDVIMGSVALNDCEIAKKLKFLQNAMGVVPSPMDCFLVNRGLKTLPLRMEQHKKSSLIIAEWLQKQPKIEKVVHPALPDHPQYELSKKQTCGHSGVFSFWHKGKLAESKTFLSSLKIFTLSESLGGYESLAGLPMMMSHGSVPQEEQLALGITDSLIRLSVGLEDTQDLIEDLDQALKNTF